MTSRTVAFLLGLRPGTALGALFLLALFLPAADEATERFVVDARPALDILALIAALALFGGRLTATFRAILAGAVAFAALLNLAAALTPSLLGRPLDLYWDLRHVPSLVGLAAESGGAWQVVGAFALAAAGLAAVWFMTGRALGALAGRRAAAALPAIGLAALLLAPAGKARLHTPALDAAAGQSRSLLHAASLAWSGGPPALPAPPTATRLDGLKGRDVYLVFVESYGSVVFDDPAFAETLRPAFADFEATLAAAGYHVATSRLVSPTYGGGSWLAHSTLASGVKLSDQFLYRQLRDGAPRGLAHQFRDAGYRTIVAMPGIKKPEPGATGFWGFDDAYYAADLRYGGPPFGWFDIPDQYTLRTLEEREKGAAGGRPLFAEIVLVSSHVPFQPVPPYVADWRDAEPYAGIPESVWREVYAPPDWTRLDRPYLKSLAYDFRVLGDWLARRVSDGALVILLGDHQPPALVGGVRRDWTVPIHVLSRDPDLVRPFLARSYAEGVAPPADPASRGMEAFLGEFLASFGSGHAVAAKN